MKNYAGMSMTNKNMKITKELVTAGINILQDASLLKNEVSTTVKGSLHGWEFERFWYYWMCIGPSIPYEEAKKLNKLNKSFFSDVRVEGYTSGTYHVNTQEGLKALADVIKKVHGNKDYYTTDYIKSAKDMRELANNGKDTFDIVPYLKVIYNRIEEAASDGMLKVDIGLPDNDLSSSKANLIVDSLSQQGYVVSHKYIDGLEISWED